MNENKVIAMVKPYIKDNELTYDEFDQIFSMDDVDLLGSAVFSQWRYLTHWAYMLTLNEKTVHWFLLVLDRMKELTRSK